MQISEFYSKKRIIIFSAFLGIFLLYILFNYVKLAFDEINVVQETPVEVERGTILDRNGKVLAVSTNYYHLSATPSVIQDVDETSSLLSPYLGMDKDTIYKLLTESKYNFVYLKKKLDQNDYDAISSVIKENKIYGLRFDKIQGRSYPENSLASQVIGFMGDDEKGLSGIEFSNQTILSPPYTNQTKEVRGKDIYLTLDANLQYKLEQIAKETIESTQAASFMLIACDAQNGEIYSYISLPTTDLNQYSLANDEEKMDRPATYAYEPGSVFKIFSVASFIETGAINPDEKFYCDGVHQIKVGNKVQSRITCLGNHGWVTAREALKYSCNDALAQMSDKIDSETFLQMIRSFGFGSKTGVELPSETRGSVKTTDDRLWSLRSKPTISIGQEISVSALQMVQAATAITNKGIPITLTLISRIADKTGKTVYDHIPEYKEPIISEYTANYILSFMETTATSGTGTRASLGDISIGVKTGTAQMMDAEKGGYSETDFVSNCMAIFPIEDPKIILYIVITKAKGETYAGRIVAPVIAKTADIIIDHFGMARANASSLAHTGLISIKADSPIIITDTVPDFKDVPKRLILPLLENENLRIQINGDGYVYDQYPPAGTPVTENMKIELYLE